jgi:hypothetical protein
MRVRLIAVVRTSLEWLLQKLPPPPATPTRVFVLVDAKTGEPIKMYADRKTTKGKTGTVHKITSDSSDAYVNMEFYGGRGGFGVFNDVRPDTIGCRWKETNAAK